jgi:hypothetical protein
MNRRVFLGIASLSFVALVPGRLPAQTAYDWTLSSGFPPPNVPVDNPMSVAHATGSAG